MNKLAQTFRDLEIYKRSFGWQQQKFNMSKRWPEHERFALTDQIRRSSRSIGANLGEAWAKRHYPAHFPRKLSDADGELQETLHCLDTARACEYLNRAAYDGLASELALIGQMLGMLTQYEKFCLA